MKSARTPHRAPRTSLALWIAATIVLSLTIGAAGWQRVVDIGQRLDAGWLFVAVCGNLAIQPFAAIQWRLLLPARQRIGLRKMLSITAVSSLAMNTTPALIGHASSVLLLARQQGIGHGTALSVLALEQLTEGIAKVTVVLLAILVLPVPSWMQQAASGLAAVVALFMAALLVAARNHDLLAQWAGRREERGGRKEEGGRSRASSFLFPPSSLLALLARWAERLETLRTPRRFLAALFACYGMKLVEGLAIIAAQQALGIDLPASSAILILAAAGFGTMLPLAPGNLGTYEASVFLAYRWLGVSAGDAVALALVQHLAYLVASTGAGYAVLSARQIRAARAR